jgi:transcription elongation factor Elf1
MGKLKNPEDVIITSEYCPRCNRKNKIAYVFNIKELTKTIVEVCPNCKLTRKLAVIQCESSEEYFELFTKCLDKSDLLGVISNGTFT